MLTHTVLGITEAEHTALQQVMAGLRDGTLVHDYDTATRALNRFNMDNVAVRRGCGTVACIGGWVWAFMQPPGVVHRDETDGHYDLYAHRTAAEEYVFGTEGEDDGVSPLYDLYFPSIHGSYGSITAAEAAQAIENFLETGSPAW